MASLKPNSGVLRALRIGCKDLKCLTYIHLLEFNNCCYCVNLHKIFGLISILVGFSLLSFAKAYDVKLP